MIVSVISVGKIPKKQFCTVYSRCGKGKNYLCRVNSIFFMFNSSIMCCVEWGG
jgi:hypothetical protein